MSTSNTTTVFSNSNQQTVIPKPKRKNQKSKETKKKEINRDATFSIRGYLFQVFTLIYLVVLNRKNLTGKFDIDKRLIKFSQEGKNREDVNFIDEENNELFIQVKHRIFNRCNLEENYLNDVLGPRGGRNYLLAKSLSGNIREVSDTEEGIEKLRNKVNRENLIYYHVVPDQQQMLEEIRGNIDVPLEQINDKINSMFFYLCNYFFHGDKQYLDVSILFSELSLDYEKERLNNSKNLNREELSEITYHSEIISGITIGKKIKQLFEILPENFLSSKEGYSAIITPLQLCKRENFEIWKKVENLIRKHQR